MKFKTVNHILIILLLLAIPLFSFTNGVLAKDTSPYHIHLSWQNDPKTTMTIGWKTGDLTESVVQYGLDREYGTEVTAEEAINHFVELTGLEPDTIYFYRVGNGKSWSEDLFFKTAPSGDHVQFTYLADSQTYVEAQTMVKAVKGIEADFFFFNGDFIETSGSASEWDIWFNDFNPITKKLPVYSSLGNHEKNISDYYELFALPGKEEYYSFDVGSVHFAVLHTMWEDFSITNENFTEQANWLVADLTVNLDAEWTIILMHRPPFSSFTRHINENWYVAINETFVPIFELFDVDLVVMGHEHAYERLEKNNITYVISGGSGARLYTPLPQIEESIIVESTFNFLFFDIYEDQFIVRGYRPNYSLIDEFKVNKQDKPDLRIATLPRTINHLWEEEQEITIEIENVGEQDITEITTARITLSNGTTWEIEVPELDVGDSEVYRYEFNVEEPTTLTWTIELDIDDLVDEVVEDNNVFLMVFNSITTDKSSFEIWAAIGSLLFLTVAVVVKRKRK